MVLYELLPCFGVLAENVQIEDDSQYYITYYIYYTDTCYIQGGAILVLSQSASPDRRYGQS